MASHGWPIPKSFDHKLFASSHDCIPGRTGVVHSCSAANWHGSHLIAHQFDRCTEDAK